MRAPATRYFAAVLVGFLCHGFAYAIAETVNIEAFINNKPHLVFDADLHAGSGVRIAAAPAAGIFVSGSEDKVLKVRSLDDGKLIKTIRVPSGPGNIGEINAVAITPDGSLIAAGGWTGPDAGQHSIYLFDATTGAMVRRIGNLPAVVMAVAFSPDGGKLAATLGSRRGFRLYSSETGWYEISSDDQYRSDSYGVTFSNDGRVATTELSGIVRVYDADGKNPFVVSSEDQGVFGVAFSPDGMTLAVGNALFGKVAIYDAETFAKRGLADLGDFEPNSLAFVSWSPDGNILHAAAMLQRHGRNNVLVWPAGTSSPPKALEVGSDTIKGLVGLAGGKFLAITGDPWIGVFAAAGDAIWQRRSDRVNAQALVETLAVSADGAIVEFDFGIPPVRMRFDTNRLELSQASESQSGMSVPDQTSIDVRDWDSTNRPKLEGEVLELSHLEFSRSVATDAARRRIVLGSDWRLAAYQYDQGEWTEKWRRSTPSVAWAVNIADQGRLAVVAYGDGSIRWHDIENNGVELLALFVTRTVIQGKGLESPPGWIVWTPEGLYETSASSFAELYWQIDEGLDAAGRVVPANAIQGMHRPEVIPFVLPKYGTAGALGGFGFQELQTLLQRVKTVTGAEVKPGPRLYALTVGVSELGSQAAHLNLKYADRDSEDLASRLKESQGPIYSNVWISNITNSEASAEGVLTALDSLRKRMEEDHSDGGDFVVVQFSGHGMYKDGRYYLLTYGSDSSRPNSIASTALEMGHVADKLKEISKLGRVLVLVDACRSDAYAADNSPLERNADFLKNLLYSDQVSVVVSSTDGQLSWERDDWENGAFTEAVVEALTKRADLNDDRIISTAEFVTFVINEVNSLTDSRQRPSVRLAYDQPMFFADREAMR